jgi:phosphatidylglycerol lysyltransferase
MIDSMTGADPRDRVLAVLRGHGHDTTSFQTLEPGLEYWFDEADSACVAYADTGGAYVVAGAPIAAPERENEVAARFLAFARERGKRVRFFALEREAIASVGLSLMHMGEQPVWRPADWPDALARKRSLREQLRRARAKGVSARQATRAEMDDPETPVRRGLDQLIARWQDARAMAPMGFVVQIDLYTFLEERHVFIAERAGEIVGVLAAVPIYARDGWFFEDVLRHPDAPNGTMELLFDHAMRAAERAGIVHVTFGLAPLAHTPSRVMAAIRDRTRWLYDFEGVRAFKAKLLPSEWHPVYLGYPERERGVRAVVDVLAAFARGSLCRFGLATLRHRAATITRILAWLLVPWTMAMAFSDTHTWFPSATVKAGWIGLDLALFVMLLTLARAWHRTLAIGLACVAAADALLGGVQVALYNLPEASRGWQPAVFVLALLAPAGAALFLWLCRDRARLYG